MKISDLSERSGVPLPTLKFYIREGILPAGRRTAKNQADYGDEHLERLLLVRALKDDAGLGIAAIARALRAADKDKKRFVVAAIDAIERPSGPPVDERSREFKEARDAVAAIGRELGWDVRPDSVSVRDAARAWVIARRSFPADSLETLRPYAEIAHRIARHEIPDDWAPTRAPMAALRYAVLGTVLFEPIILAFRRMAHIARSAEVEQGRAGRGRAASKTR